MGTHRISGWPAVVFFGFVAWTITGLSLQSHGQDVSSTKRTMLDVVRAIDSVSPKEMEWVTAFVEKRLSQFPKDSLAHCMQAIIHFRSQDFEKTLKSIQAANAGDTADLTRSTMAKFQLLCAINTDDQPQSNRLFQALMQASQRESTSMPNRKSFCEWLGEIVGTLDHPDAQSPIDPETLSTAKRNMRAMAEVTLSQAFDHHYELAKARTDRIAQSLNKHTELGDAAFREHAKEQSDQLTKLETIMSESTKEKKEFSDTNLAATKTLKNQVVGLRDQIRGIEREWAIVTPGMPRPIPPPIPPRRELIYVDPFQIRIVVEYVEGRRYERQIQERRSTFDMEAERDLIYQGQLGLYNSQSTLYQQYQSNLSEWKRQDAGRRKQLAERRTDLENQLAQVRTQLDQLEDDRKDNMGGNSDIKKAITQLKLELQAIQDVMRAADLGKPHLALRTNRVDGWLIAEEKSRLVRLYQGQL
ncbi:MAG: hypothetical protein ABL921_22260 [Pirellula sp.]